MGLGLPMGFDKPSHTHVWHMYPPVLIYGIHWYMLYKSNMEQSVCVCILVCWGWWSLMVGPRWEGLRLRWWKSSKFYVPNSDYYRRMLRGSLRGWEGIRCLRRSINWNTYEIEGNARLKLFFDWTDLPKTFNYLSCYISDRMLLLITRWKLRDSRLHGRKPASLPPWNKRISPVEVSVCVEGAVSEDINIRI